MDDPKKPAVPEESEAPAQPEKPRTGGFGAFADVYRARWAANHPNMRPRGTAEQTDAVSEPATPPPAQQPPDPGVAKQATRDEKRLPRAGEHS